MDPETGEAGEWVSGEPEALPAPRTSLSNDDDPLTGPFWKIFTNSKQKLDVEVDTMKMLELINDQGHWLYAKETKQNTHELSYEFVHIADKIVDSSNEFAIKKKTQNFVAALPKQIIEPYDVANIDLVTKKLINGGQRYFAPAILEALPFRKNLKFITDDSHHCYHFYRDKYVKVTKDKVETLSYAGLPEHIWRRQMIDRDYIPVDDPGIGDFARFLAISATSKHFSEGPRWSEVDITRYQSMCTAIGYLLHGYKNPSTPKVIVGIDSYMGETNKESNGGSGKGIFIESLKRILVVKHIDGRTFKTTDAHPLTGMKPGTRIISFSDVRANFDIGYIFGMATDGINFNEKHMKGITIEPEEAPKLYVSMNFLPKGEGRSYTRRQFIMEFGEYFTETRIPFDVFGHNLLREDWPAEQWVLFDNFMMDCVREFLQHGLVPFPEISLNIKKANDALPLAVRDWFGMDDDNARYQVTEDGAIGMDVHEYVLKDMFEDFIANVPEFSSIHQNSFTIYMKAWCDYKGYIKNRHKSKSGYRDMRNKIDYVTFFRRK